MIKQLAHLYLSLGFLILLLGNSNSLSHAASTDLSSELIVDGNMTLCLPNKSGANELEFTPYLSLFCDDILFHSPSYENPIFGCVDPNASNYNQQATVDDGSCSYEIFSSGSMSISYDSLVIHGSTSDLELEVSFNIHNNSDSVIDVYVLRNILSENTPDNWFCWDMCYLPNTDTSLFSSQILSESYSNEFSSHLVPEMYGGSYIIEYCFFNKTDFTDRVCVQVHYIIDGDIPGCMDLNALNYQSNATIDNGECFLYPEPNWTNSSFELATHSIVISSDTEILINNEPITTGDWIGLFYDSEQGPVCMAYTVWQEQNINFLAASYEAVLGEGSIPSDSSFIWKVWDASTSVIWPMNVEYMSHLSSHSVFEENGQSGLLSMHNINPITQQQIDFPEGWSMFSSYMITEDMNVISFFEPIYDDIIIVKNNVGAAYLAVYQFNAIGDLEIGQGYIVKTSQACSVSLEGVFAKGELYPISLVAGWNMIGYLRNEPEFVEVIFSDLVAQGLVKLVKDYEGNAYLPQWSFNAIGTLKPGRAYQVKTFEEGILQY